MRLWVALVVGLLIFVSIGKSQTFDGFLKGAKVSKVIEKDLGNSTRVKIAVVESARKGSLISKYLLSPPTLLMHIEDAEGQDIVIVNTYVGYLNPEGQASSVELAKRVYGILEQLQGCKQDPRLESAMKSISLSFGYDMERYKKALRNAVQLIVSPEFKNCKLDSEHTLKKHINRIHLAYEIATKREIQEIKDGHFAVVSYPDKEAMDVGNYIAVEPKKVKRVAKLCKYKFEYGPPGASGRYIYDELTEVFGKMLMLKCPHTLELLLK